MTRVDPGAGAMTGGTTSVARRSVVKKTSATTCNGILGKVRSIAENTRTTDFMAVAG
jgi:hypothetical protein